MKMRIAALLTLWIATLAAAPATPPIGFVLPPAQTAPQLGEPSAPVTAERAARKLDDQAIPDFDTYRTAHAVAWATLLSEGASGDATHYTLATVMQFARDADRITAQNQAPLGHGVPASRAF